MSAEKACRDHGKKIWESISGRMRQNQATAQVLKTLHLKEQEKLPKRFRIDTEAQGRGVTVSSTQAPGSRESARPTSPDGEHSGDPAQHVEPQFKEDVKGDSGFHNTETRETLLEWISPLDFSKLQAEIRRKRHPGSCSWIRGRYEFNRWLSGMGSAWRYLVITGEPGSGKSCVWYGFA